MIDVWIIIITHQWSSQVNSSLQHYNYLSLEVPPTQPDEIKRRSPLEILSVQITVAWRVCLLDSARIRSKLLTTSITHYQRCFRMPLLRPQARRRPFWYKIQTCDWSIKSRGNRLGRDVIRRDFTVLTISQWWSDCRWYNCQSFSLCSVPVVRLFQHVGAQNCYSRRRSSRPSLSRLLRILWSKTKVRPTIQRKAQSTWVVHYCCLWLSPQS